MNVYQHATTTTRKIKFMREAGAVRRCHTVPIIGEYNVGIHKFNMLSMLRILWPDAPLPLVWAILEHDAPERLTGDIPAPPKWFGVVDKDNLAQIEHDILVDTLGYDHAIALSKDEAMWLAGLDIFELALFCRDQIHIGNRNMEVMLERIHKYVKRDAARFAPAVLDAYWESFGDDWSMLPDLGDL
jgi:hypothetical protein